MRRPAPAAGPGPALVRQSGTSFIGREREPAELRALLVAGRLVTITGVGGAGKSRLALEAARAELPRHPDGTWLIEPAALTQSDLVPHVVAATLGVRTFDHAWRTGQELTLDTAADMAVQESELASRPAPHRP